MISQEEVCIWFKNLEGCSRIELMCALLDSCLPLELRFLGTYLEYAAGKHYTHLQKWEREANKTSSWFSSDNFSNTAFRRRFCIFLALLHSHNRAIALKLFDVLGNWEDTSIDNDSKEQETAKQKNENSNNDKEKEDSEDIEQEQISFCNEMKLLFSMASLHPAFDFSQRSKLRKKKENFSSTHETNDIDDDLVLVENEETESIGLKENIDFKQLINQEMIIGDTETSSLAASTSLRSINTPVIICTVAHTEMMTTVPTTVQAINTISSIAAAAPPRQLPNFQQPPQQQQQRQLTRLPSMENVFTLPYRNITPQMLIPQSSLPMHRPVNNQMSIHGLVPGVPVHVVNNTRFLQNNVSAHSNISSNNTIPPSNFVPNDDLIISPTVPVFPTPLSLVSSNGTNCRNVNVLNNMSNINILPLSNHNISQRNIQNTIPPLTRFCYQQPVKLGLGTLRSPSLDDSIIPSLVTVSNPTMTIKNTVRPQLSFVQSSSSATAIVSSGLAQRRCLSESDTYEKANQEQLVAGLNAKNMQQVSFSGANPTQLLHLDSALNKSKNIGPYIHPSSQISSRLIGNNNVHQIFMYANPIFQNNSSTNTLNDTSNILSQQQLRLPQTSKIITNSVPNVIYPSQMQMPISSAVLEPMITNIQMTNYSSEKSTIPTGLNGGYVSANNVDLKGNRKNIHRTENYRKFDGQLINELSVNIPISKSSPIPVKRTQLSALGRFSQDTLESPYESPSQSPRPSPFCSPAQSPVAQRKSNNPKEIAEQYASASSWLKSLRLHKYSDKLEKYTFDEMKHLDVESLVNLGLTQGASKKLKQQVESLVSRGFKEFGSPDNLLNTELHTLHLALSPASLSPNNSRYLSSHRSTNNTDSFYSAYDGGHSESSSPVSSNFSEVSRSPPLVLNMVNNNQNEEFQQQNRSSGVAADVSTTTTPVGNFSQQQNTVPHTFHTFGNPNAKTKQDNFIEDGFDYSDDEVFSSRKKSLNATCYNCGHFGHYGDECTEQTMESQTYSRYAYQLDYSRTNNTSPTPNETSSSSTYLNRNTASR